MDAMTIAVDLAKHVFDSGDRNPGGPVTSRRRLTRAQFARLLQTAAPAQVLMEAVRPRTTGAARRRRPGIR
jgi:hypothetical protein